MGDTTKIELNALKMINFKNSKNKNNRRSYSMPYSPSRYTSSEMMLKGIINNGFNTSSNRIKYSRV